VSEEKIMSELSMLKVSLPSDIIEYVRVELGYQLTPICEQNDNGFVVVIHNAELDDREINLVITRFQNEYFRTVCEVTACNNQAGFQVTVTWL